MGYESRVIIARRYTVDPALVEVIAELKLSQMGNGFYPLFTKEFDGVYYDFYDGETIIREDKYGEKLKYATFDEVLNWCLANKQEHNYRRLDLLLAVLQNIQVGWNGELDGFIVIHYGY